MSKKVIKIEKSKLEKLINETVKDYVQKYGMVFNYYPHRNEIKNINQFRLVDKNSLSDNVVLGEGILRTYPTDITLRYVFNQMNDEFLELYVPEEQQNDDEIANHIIACVIKQDHFAKDIDYLQRLEKAFNACGYCNSAQQERDNGFVKTMCYQFEPRYQKERNDITPFIYHVTTLNKLNNILRIGFVPKNSCTFGLKYDGRCHFFVEHESLNQIIDDYRNLWNKTNKEYNNGQLKENNDFVVIEIDTEKLKNVKFYPDPNFPKGQAVFTYANIPKESIANYYVFKTEEQ